ncbi:MAG: YajQ family cyclic di-GMP-binding protein [Phycisphaerae bacterium]
MAADSSFDIVNEINWQELDNAVVQAQKEISTRFDFRGTAAAVSQLDKKEKLLTVTADNETQLNAVMQVVISKMVKRGVDPRSLDRQKLEAATHNTVRQKIKLKSGIERETAKALQKRIKDMGLKVNASIQGESLRVSGAKKDDLQAVIADLRAKPPEIPIQFNNYR